MNNQVTICSVGDLMVCDSPLYASVGVGSSYPQLKGKLFADCRDIFTGADIVIGNFETVVHKPANSSLKEIQMCCTEDVIKELRDNGFGILNLANNHCMQHGPEGFSETEASCKKYGIQPIGIRDEEPYEITVNGVRLVFLSLCIHIEWYQPDHILYEDRIEKILEDIKAIRKRDDRTVIIVSVHWGDEFAPFPSNAQITLGHKMIDLGANIVLGHHPHVYQGIEEYHSGIIAYSQGNFISDMVPEICRQTGILTLQAEAVQEGVSVSYAFQPCFINDSYLPVLSKEEWISERDKMLAESLEGRHTDQEYWKTIGHNHSIAHTGFKQYFRKNLRKYKPGIAVKMIIEFVGRKARRIIGNTTDGQVSSMDESIRCAADRVQ